MCVCARERENPVLSFAATLSLAPDLGGRAVEEEAVGRALEQLHREVVRRRRVVPPALGDLPHELPRADPVLQVPVELAAVKVRPLRSPREGGLEPLGPEVVKVRQGRQTLRVVPRVVPKRKNQMRMGECVLERECVCVCQREVESERERVCSRTGRGPGGSWPSGRPTA